MGPGGPLGWGGVEGVICCRAGVKEAVQGVEGRVVWKSGVIGGYPVMMKVLTFL